MKYIHIQYLNSTYYLHMKTVTRTLKKIKPVEVVIEKPSFIIIQRM